MRRFVDHVGQDLKYALRQLRRSPAFAAVAIGSLAIGIGANVTVYSAAHAVLQQRPDAARPDELVRVYRGDHSPLPRDWFLYFAHNSHKIAAYIAEDLTAVGVDQNGTAERHRVAVVSENFFSDLGVPAAVGSVFAAPAGTNVGAVVVLTHAYWTAHFGADPGIVGKILRLNDQPFTIAGVAREGFRSSQFGWSPQMFVPLSELGRLTGRSDNAVSQSSMYITGRLADGATAKQAEDEILSLAPSLPGLSQSDRQQIGRAGAFNVAPARGITAEIRSQSAIISIFLMAVVGTVLLIACANLANLLLARATGRRREIAIRMALGVNRGRLIQQMLTESVVLAAISGAAGLAIAYYVSRLAAGFIPADTEMAITFTPDTNVIVFASLLALATGVVFGLAPALQAGRADVQSTLRTDSAGAGSRRSTLRSVFLAGQVALATVLLVTATLFVQGLGAAQNINPGFRTERISDVTIDLSLRQYDAGRGRVYYENALRAVRDLPYVQAAALVATPPLTGSNSGTSVALANADTTDRSVYRGTTFTQVTPNYFEMFGIPIVRGRAFASSDADGAQAVVVVNESFAHMFWSDGDAVGKSIRIGRDVATIVGVTPDTKYKSLNDRNEPFMYLPFAQNYSSSMVLQVRLANGTAVERAGVHTAVQALDPALALGPATTMDDDMRISLLPTRIGASLLGSFGLLALFLATIGVYGVTAYLVGQRTTEIGIRSALGASSRSVLTLMMRDTVRLVLIGLAIGLAGGIGIGAAISGWLFGIRPVDPIALGSAAAALVSVAMLATWIPARRALRVDPIKALRSE